MPLRAVPCRARGQRSEDSIPVPAQRTLSQGALPAPSAHGEDASFPALTPYVLRMETVELVGRDGNRLAADVEGDEGAPPVVLLHGGGQTRHSWGTTLRVLGHAGWHAFSVDLRGHGDSEWAADGDYTLDAFAGDVRAVARELGRPPALVGASLGGLASLAAIGEHPHEHVASALVLVDVAPRTEAEGRERIGAFMVEHMEEGFGSL